VDPSFPAGHFSEHWVVIVAGRGVGQARKVTSYTTSPAQSTFTVSPAWDVVPDPASSRVVVSRMWWQAFVLGNEVDIRQCLKPRKHPELQVTQHGVIVLWGSHSDSVVQGNVQHEADGIILNPKHFIPYTNPNGHFFPTDHQVAYFADIRSNTIDGETDWAWTCSRGGIQLWHQSTSKATALPMLPAYGVTVAHNWIRKSDATQGGGIGMERAFLDEPLGTHWESTLISRNTILEIDGEAPHDLPNLGFCGTHPRVEVSINGRHLGDEEQHVSNTVLSANPDIDCVEDVVDQGVRTICIP
jgi:hypothetical protein